MLETLTRGFRAARLSLQGKTEITEENIESALREIRVSLLEADVEFNVVKSFLARIKEKTLGEVVTLKVKHKDKVSKITPSDYFIKVCHDELVSLMHSPDQGFTFEKGVLKKIMLVGLQGSGKTTTAAKLALHLKKKGANPLLVAADIQRPAAVDQLLILGRKIDVTVFYIKGFDPPELCTLAIEQARNVGKDVVILDTAGRLAIDEELMLELERIKEKTRPQEILYICDAMIGQDAVRTAKEFDRRVGLTGFIMTKMEGDARGGAALSIKEVTGKPIRFIGVGEGLDKLEEFRPEGIASRILGFGDVVGLVKDFEEVVDEKKAEEDAIKMMKGKFTFDDFLNQIGMIKKVGSLQDILEKLPFFGDIVPQGFTLPDSELDRIEAMINSMTREERFNPDIINESRMRRIALGSGRSPQEVKSLMERFFIARNLMKQFGRASGLFGAMKSMRRGFRGGGMGMPGLDLTRLLSNPMEDIERSLRSEKSVIKVDRQKLKEKRRDEKRRKKKKRH